MSFAGVNGHVRSYYRASRFPRQVNVAFDDAMFAEIKGRAEKDGISLAEMIRQLVEWGLET
jgi:hypothetical protein